MEQIKRFRIPLVGAVAAVVVALVVWSAWISPEGNKASALSLQKSQALAQEQSLQTQLATLKEEQRNVKANCAQLNRDLTMIPTSPDASQFLQQITALAQASGDPHTPSYSLGTPTATPGSTAASTGAGAAPAGTSVITVQLSLAGTFGQMTQFIQGVSSFKRLFTISSISITGGPVISGSQLAAAGTPNYSLALTGSIYYAPAGQANICSAPAAH